MAFIRVGFFQDFRSADTLLIDVDREGVDALIAWLQVSVSDRGVVFGDCPGSVIQPGLRVELRRVAHDKGIARTSGTEFVWKRSDEGWAEVIEKLAVMKTGAGHQYLDGPTDDVQVMASKGEYGNAWWRRHGS